MKNNLFLALIVIFISSCRVNVLNLKSDKYSIRKKEQDQWSEFSNWQNNSVKIKLKKSPLTILKPKIVIYEDPKLVYKILDDGIESKTDSGDNVVTFQCKDNQGDNCYAIFIENNSKTNLIFYYLDVNYRYDITEDGSEK